MNIDLRSDTVTKPSKAMLEYMFSAEVGDDVFEEDPTINALEEKAAALFGMEAGIFCPSGTMTNQIGIKINSEPPGEIICDELSHVYLYEGGGIAFNSGLSARLLQGDRGRINVDLLENAVNPDDVHKPVSQIVSVENTSNRGGGSIYDFRDLESMSKFCRSNNISYHLDGARIFNALIEVEYTAHDLGPLFDTISICLSKGLGCPVGSVLLGSKEKIRNARRIRKVLGGGMRQAGFLAAAGIFALDHNIDRLKEDHSRAKQIESCLKELPFVQGVIPVETNIVVFQLNDKIDGAEFLTSLKNAGVLAVPFGNRQVRFTCHLDFTDDHLNELIEILRGI